MRANGSGIMKLSQVFIVQARLAAQTIGTSGAFTWSGAPAGNLFYLIVGTDGGSVESGWGFAGPAAERNGSTASGECGVATKDPANICP